MTELAKYRFNYFTLQFTNVFFTFISLYLKNSGMDGTQVGAVLSFAPVITALTLPFLGIFDKGSRARKILVSVCCLLVIAAEWLILSTKVFAVVAPLVILASVARAPVSTSIESVTTLYCMESKREFATVRIWASYGYIASTVAVSLIFEAFDYYFVAIVSSLSYLLLLADWLIVKPLKLDKNIKTKEHNLKLLFKNKNYIAFLLYQVLVYSIFTLNTSYDLLYLDARGQAATMFGVCSLVRVSFEVLTLMFLSQRQFVLKKVMVLAPVFLMVQAIVFYMEMSMGLVFIATAATGIGGGMIFYANNKYVSKIVRPENITMSIYVYTMAFNLFAALYIFLGGVVIDAFAIKYIYLGSFAVLAVGVMFSINFIKSEKETSFLHLKLVHGRA